MVNNTTFTIHSVKYGSITADALVSDWYNLQDGTEQNLTFWFDEPNLTGQQLIVDDGESQTISAGETPEYNRVIVDGTLTVDGDLTTDLLVGSRTVTGTGTISGGDTPGHAIVEQFATFAGQSSTGTELEGPPFYREHLENNDYVESLLLGFEPSADLQAEGITGIWGVVTGGSTQRNSVLTRNSFELRVFKLAEFHEYDNHAAVRSALEI